MFSNLHVLSVKPIKAYLLCESPATISMLTGLWPEEAVVWTVFNSGIALLNRLFLEPPDLLIATATSRDLSVEKLVRTVKAENVYSSIRTVLLVEQAPLAEGVDWTQLEVDDFLLLPNTPALLRARLELALVRGTRSLDANPLTHLPGNVSIIQTVNRYAAENTDFAMAYADIDNFKSFNDRYGFARGDEAILMTARVISSTVNNFNVYPNFVGHVGGDDFVFVLPEEVIREACEQILTAYDAIVPAFYDTDDARRGFILSHDRRGNILHFPFLSISIAVVVNRNNRFRQFSELSHVAGQLKKKVKSQPGSVYLVERRYVSQAADANATPSPARDEGAVDWPVDASGPTSASSAAAG